MKCMKKTKTDLQLSPYYNSDGVQVMVLSLEMPYTDVMGQQCFEGPSCLHFLADEFGSGCLWMMHLWKQENDS